MPNPPRRPLSNEELDDLARLREIFLMRKRQTHLTQKELSQKCGWSGQQAVQAYFSGATPLNLEAAFRFALALETPLDAISPKLAQKAAAYFEKTRAGQAVTQSFAQRSHALMETITILDRELENAITRLITTYDTAPQAGIKIAKAIIALTEASDAGK
jgi:hypothetical protein